MTIRAKYYILFIIFLSFGCRHKSTEDAGGFLELAEPLNYTVKYIPVEKYPEIIDRKMLSFNNANFPDNLLKMKKVFLVQRINFHPGTKNIDFIDTAGYDVVVKNDSLKLYWFVDFDSELKSTRIEESTFQEHELFMKEGEKMRNSIK